jgi:hypothetical protein
MESSSDWRAGMNRTSCSDCRLGVSVLFVGRLVWSAFWFCENTNQGWLADSRVRFEKGWLLKCSCIEMEK